MQRLSTIIGIGALVVGAVASIVVAVFLAISTETRSIDAVQTVLEQSGLDWVEVSANGLQVQLNGTAPSEASHFRALSQAGSVVDPDRIVNEMEVQLRDTSAPPRFSVDMLRNDDGIQLIGLVPSDSDPATVNEVLARLGEGAEVTNMIETADFPMPDRWRPPLRYGLRALEELPRAKVTVYEARVEVQAVSESINQRAQFLATLQRGQPRDVQVVLDISAPRPVITPFALRFVIDDDGARFDTCAADTLEARNRIVAAAETAGATGLITCQVWLGVPSPQWAEAVETAIAALADLGAGTVAFSDADVTLIAVAGTDQAAFDRAIGELESDMPEVFSLSGVLPDPPETETAVAAQTPRFFADLSEDGQVRIRGRLPEGAVGASVAAYARALFGRQNADVATREVADLPDGWAVRAMVGLDALSTISDGRLVLEPAGLRLEGRTGNPDAISDLTRLLSERLGQTAAFDLDVVYVEALDPVASLPTPQECVARIQAIQDEGKIVFNPGSVEITDEAGEILDRIAEILPDCRHVRMEISGHTDSQGREEMNLNLSQSRAEAVLNGLLARNVLVSNLTAQGYGESQPLADNSTDAGRERNRRIEFRLLTSAFTGEEVDGPNLVDGRPSLAPVERPEIRPAPRPDVVARSRSHGQRSRGRLSDEPV